MRPTFEARELKESLLQYLSTTYALTDEGARARLHEFLGNETTGMFRGPYLRVRTPFTSAGPGWEDLLDWRPVGNFTPHAHQAAAWARLTAKDGHEPEPTVVTTGTGSGKTEAFLYPILDHCARERAAGREGIKAILLYPMNALATDQADRINTLLTGNDDLSLVRAGLYIGDRPATEYERVATRRADMWLTPPDILLTNYKMLDLLLQRERDVPLWMDADLRYVVVDEFHSYDGAQGTDLAMLLRRLAAFAGAPEPGRPLGRICPVATSATLGAGGTETDALLRTVNAVFGVELTEDAVLGENRQAVAEFLPSQGFDPNLPQPLPEELAALPDPTWSDDAFAGLIEAVTGVRDTDPFRLGATLKTHLLTAAVLHTFDESVRTVDEVLNLMWRERAASWARAVTNKPDVAAVALARFVALLSYARDPSSTVDEPRPLVHVEAHQWVRSVTRLVRGVLPWPEAEFRWDTPGAGPALNPAAPATTTGGGVSASLFLPAIYCRACGRSGWAVFSPERDNHAVEFDPMRIRRASTSRDKIRVRNLIAATDREAADRPGEGATDSWLLVLDGLAGRLRTPSDGDYTDGAPQLSTPDSAFVLANISKTANTAAEDDWCPACGERNAIRYLGTGPAALAAAAITQLFTGGELDETQGEDKTLMFNDSVQDAAHRSGFVASRSFTFSLRALLNQYLSEEKPTALHELIANVVTKTTQPRTLSAVVPTDLHDLRGVARLLSGQGRGGDLRTWELIGERLAFDAISEFGFRSRNGRTLELTRTAAASVRIPDPTAAVELTRAAYLAAAEGLTDAVEPDAAAFLGFLRVFLERLRTRGAVHHQWLHRYLDEAGTSRYPVWGGRPTGMRAFPRGVAAPRFLLAAPKERSEFDVATGRLSWYERWAARCFGLPRANSPVFWQQLLPVLAEAGLLSVGTPNDSSARIYGLQPGAIDIQRLTDAEVNAAFVRCPVCFWEQTVHPSLLGQWHGQPCPAYRCRTGRLVAGDRPEQFGVHHRDRDFSRDYYRRLYREAGTYQVITAEHTGMLTRAQRERTEAAFRGREFNSPNVLSCTPTLELGIDVGELSAVVLAALPRRPANYAQQVGRAGRRTGNAYLLTIPDRSRRDLYFLDQPTEMIAGQIRPPGAHLSAIEILRRQYLAHLLDLAAHGRLTRQDGVRLRPMPAQAPALFGESGYLVDLVDTALAHGGELVAAFLALFPDTEPDKINDEAGADLVDFATRGLRGAVEDAERDWWRNYNLLQARLKLINQTVDELNDGDPEAAEQKAELRAERRAIGKRLSDVGRTPAQEALCDLGLLPNYALLDTMTALQATLYWTAERDGRRYYDSELREYDRPRRYALSELAPGNTFYVNGYRHEITGLELRQGAVQQWRFCPDCGYVRTANAAADRTPCPRCAGARIADDGSCLHHVVEPAVVTARDRREDARISDDRDERDRRFYTVIDAVDMPAKQIRPDTSWQHKKVTFGVDYCRTAMIRRVNVGQARYDRPPQDDIAGNTVRLSPFHVCTACGAATADGLPVINHHVDATSSSAARRPEVRHHRPWCPLRRGSSVGAGAGAETVVQQPVLLVHQLRTEAVRILLPAATVLVEERVHSFRAALRVGIDRHYGGDPAHLDTTLAVVPDGPTGQRRHYLVVFDRLPGGTGYLHRLTKQSAFRDTLRDARRVLARCPCKEEGRRACHRCLHRYTPERFQDIVSRREALDMLNELLGPADPNGEPTADEWRTEPVVNTDLVGLDKQVESDLEARFLTALRRWVELDEHASLDEDSQSSGYLRFADRTGVVRWRLTNQRAYQRTRTDFTFQRIDGPPQTVTVYLDGYRYHATREHNRIAADADKRAELRADGHVVFQLNWADLDLFDGRETTEPPVWPPYAGTGQNHARSTYEAFGHARSELEGAVFTNPIETLLGYLRDPDNTVWSARAASVVAGLIADSTPIAAGTDRVGAVAALRAELAGLGGSDAGGSGPVTIARCTDTTGLVLRYAVDGSAGEAADDLRWSVIAVLDDADSVLDTDEHKLRWRSWLYWSNLIQFLEFTDGSGVALATSQAAGFPVETLDLGGRIRLAEASTVEPRDPAWTEIIDILEEDEPDTALTRVAHLLVTHGKQAPVFGHELGAARYQIDFAWPSVQLGVLGKLGEGSDAQRRDQAYQDAGWHVRTAEDWLNDTDTLLDTIPDAEGAAAR